MAVFGYFTKRAQQAIELARQAAVKASQPFVGTVHLLQGLLLAGGNYPAEIKILILSLLITIQKLIYK